MSNLQESRLGHVKVLERRIAPPAVVVGQVIVRGAEVSGSDSDGTGEAPFGVIVAFHLITRPAAQAIVEQSSAECCSVSPIPLAVQITVPTCTPCN